MTPATLTPKAASAARARRTRAIAPGSGRRPTLDDLLVGVWEGLHTDREAGCPVCGGALRAEPRAGRPPVAGRCGDCGSTLS